MSADNDLIIPDFSHLLPELEDFTRDLLLGNGLISSVEAEFGVDFEGKSSAGVFGFSDFASFSSFIEDEKNAKVISSNFGTNFSEPAGLETLEALSIPTPCNGLLNESQDDVLKKGLSAALCAEQIGLPSPTTKLKCMTLNSDDSFPFPASVSPGRNLMLNGSISTSPTTKLKCMTLNSDDSFPFPASVSPGRNLMLNGTISTSPTTKLKCTTLNTDDSFPFPASVSPGRNLMLNGSISTSPVMLSSSAVSSPSYSSSDGSCAPGSSPSSLVVNDVVNGVLSEDESLRVSQVNSFSKQPSCSAGLADPLGTLCRVTTGIQLLRNGHAAIPPYMVEEATQFPSMQRSQSSHALGQIRSTATRHASSEECRISGPEFSIPAYSKFCPYKLAQMVDMNTSSSMKSMRRVYSTGDLQGINDLNIGYSSNSPLPVEQFNREEGCRFGHYTMEERRMRLHRYRQKRMARNFNKKIKYACRKTLADSRPRIRGRFAKTDEISETVIKGYEIQNDEDDEARQDKILMPHSPVGNCWQTLPAAFLC